MFILIDIIFSLENYSLIFPFNTIIPKEPNLTTSFNTEINDIIMKNIIINDIYIQIRIGYPSQIVHLYLDINSDDFFISKSDVILEKNYAKKDEIFYFNQKLSSTFNLNSEKNIYFHPHSSQYASDYFTFQSTSPKIEIKNITFLLAFQVYGPIHGMIGLKKVNKDNKDNGREDFLSLLKRSNLTTNYIWYLYYEDKFNGSLFVGNYPHEDDYLNKNINNKFIKKNNFRKVNSIITKDNWERNWALKFEKIFLENKSVSSVGENFEILIDCKKCKIAILKPNIGVIIGNKKYLTLFENNFINNFINKKICYKNILKIDIIYSQKTFFYYYCNSSFISEIKSNFMPIIFEHKQFNYTFNLYFEDLFIKKDKYIYSKIIFEEYPDKKWIFGSPFINKYLLVFDSQSEEIGFYYEQPKEEKKEKNEEKNIDKNNEQNKEKNNKCFRYIIISIIIGIFLFLIGIIIGRALFRLKGRISSKDIEYKYEYSLINKGNKLI